MGRTIVSEGDKSRRADLQLMFVNLKFLLYQKIFRSLWAAARHSLRGIHHPKKINARGLSALAMRHPYSQNEPTADSRFGYMH